MGNLHLQVHISVKMNGSKERSKSVFKTGKEWEWNLGPKECEKGLAVGCGLETQLDKT